MMYVNVLNYFKYINTWFRFFLFIFILEVAKSDLDFASIFPFNQIESIQGVAEFVQIVTV